MTLLPHLSVRHAFRIILTFTIVLIVFCTSQVHAQIGGMPGSYSRLGFGARGIGMGNALSAVTTGDAVGYYNPAILPFAEYRNASASFGILSFDRRLNFLSYTQPLGKPSATEETVTVKNRAGISAGIINSGVSKIDGRDSDGEPTGDLQTSENQMFLSFGTQLQNKLCIGIGIKYLYHHLYTSVNSSTFGVDVGLLYPVSDQLTIAVTGRDFVSKYNWDTKGIYGEQASNTVDKFPQLYTIGAAYKLPDSLGIVALDVEFSNQSTMTMKAGAEIVLLKPTQEEDAGFNPAVLVRAGMDRIDLKENGNGIRPALGFSLRQGVNSLTPTLNYAFVLEPFATSGMHMISLSVIF